MDPRFCGQDNWVFDCEICVYNGGGRRGRGGRGLEVEWKIVNTILNVLSLIACRTSQVSMFRWCSEIFSGVLEKYQSWGCR